MVSPGKHTKRKLEKLDAHHNEARERQSSVDFKRRRVVLKETRNKQAETTQKREGITYLKGKLLELSQATRKVFCVWKGVGGLRNGRTHPCLLSYQTKNY